jgi:hypothetical protein
MAEAIDRDRAGSRKTDRVAAGAPIHQLLLVEPLRHTRVPFAGYRTDLTRTVLPQANAYAMIGRRAAAAGIATRLGNQQLPGDRDHGLSQERRHA